MRKWTLILFGLLGASILLGLPDKIMQRNNGIIIRYDSAPPAWQDGLVIRYSPTPGWIEVWRDGELESEWQPRDGEIYGVLDELLEDKIPMSPPEQIKPLITHASKATFVT